MEKLTKNDYIEIAKEITKRFNQRFNKNYRVSLKTIAEDQKDNPNSNINYEKSGGYYNPNNKEIIIFYDQIEKLRKVGVQNNSNTHQGLTYLIFAIYHELNHRLQFEHPQYLTSLETISNEPMEELYKFMIDVEKITFSTDFYKDNHDNMLLEIDADTKGIRNAHYFCKNILKISPPIDYNYYAHFYTYNSYRLVNYDPQFFIERLNQFIKLYPSIVKKQNKYFGNQSFYEFFDETGKYKSVQEIMSNSIIQNCDPNIISAIMSSSHFIETIDKMTQEERDYVLNCALKTYNRYKINKKWCEQEREKAQKSLEYLRIFSNTDSTINQIYSKNINSLAILSYYKELKHNLDKFGYYQENYHSKH